MDKTILQIPITKTLKREAKLVAVSYGFSSLQDLMRVMLTKLANKQLTIQIYDQPIPLSKKNESRYRKMEKDFKEGKNVYTVKDVPALMEHSNQKLHTPSLRGGHPPATDAAITEIDPSTGSG